MLLASFLLASILTAGPEQPVAPPLRAPAPYGMNVHGIAVSGDKALIVWGDPFGLRGVRIDRHGNYLDAQPMMLRPHAHSRYFPVGTVSRAANGWLVAWTPGLEGRFVSDAGVAGRPFEMDSAGPFDFRRVDFNGSQFLVLTGRTVRLRDANGAPVGEPFTIEKAVWPYDVVPLDQGFLLVHGTEDDTISVTRIMNGSVTERLTLVSGVDAASAAAGTDGSRLVIAWSVQRGDAYDVYTLDENENARLLLQDGGIVREILKIGGTNFIVLDKGGRGTRVISFDGSRSRTWEGPEFHYARGAASFGDRGVLAFRAASRTRIQLIDAHLNDIGPERPLPFETGTQERPSVVRTKNGEALAIWVESGGGSSYGIAGRRFDAAGNPAGDAMWLAALWNEQNVRTHVASDGENYFFVWNAASGIVAGSNAFGGARAIPNSRPDESCVAWTGTHYIVGSIDAIAGTVRASHFTPDGTLAFDVTLANANGLSGLTCASSGKGTLFAWSRESFVEGVLLTTAPGPQILFGPGSDPAVAANGNSFAIAWKNGALVEHARVDANGGILVNTSAPVFGGLPLSIGSFSNRWLLTRGLQELLATEIANDGRPGGDVVLSPNVQGDAAIAGGDAPLVLYTRDGRVFRRTITAAPQPPRRRSVGR